jgi:hypothetical protein
MNREANSTLEHPDQLALARQFTKEGFRSLGQEGYESH